MLDFFKSTTTPNMDVQYFTSITTLIEWQTWRKPRGVKNVFMLGVGGGSSGAVGANTNTTNNGGAAGGSGAQMSCWLPAFFVPDVLYVQCGLGGRQPATLVNGALQVGGGNTSVAIEPSTTAIAQTRLLVANGGTNGAVTGGTVSSATNVSLADRGFTQFFVGQNGTSTGTNLVLPVTGLMVTGGCAGGTSATVNGVAGNGPNAPVGATINNYFTPSTTGGAGASGATPAGNGQGGWSSQYFMLSYGGAGGGGSSQTAGGIAGAGGNGAPGAGGGGSGGASSVANLTLARPGNGGDGFVFIISW